MPPTRHGPGAFIDWYELVRTIGSGGAGTVFEAHDPSIGRRVALKVLNRREGDGARRAEARFLRERRIAAQIRHPHVVDVLDLGVHAGLPFLVMELVEGETLASLIEREERLPVARAVELALALVSAVATLHTGGIIHRDIKPANVLLPAERPLCPKLADFGASWCEEDMAPITRPGSLVGTPEYLAPELIRFRRRADERSDQYALGVLLYECATGARPFGGSTKYQRLHAAVSAEVVPPSVRAAASSSIARTSVPPGFDEVVLRAMHRDPARRFPSVTALGEALLAFAPDPVAAYWRGAFAPQEPEGPLPPSRRVARSSPPAAHAKASPVIDAFDGVAVAARGDVFSMLWSKAARVERVRWQFDALEAAIARQPAGETLVVLMIILPSSDPPDRPAREENGRRIRELHPGVRLLSTVIVGDGVRQILVRSIVRAMLVPHRYGADRATLESKIDAGILRVRGAAGPATPAIEAIHADVCAMHAALGLPEPQIGARRAPSGERPRVPGPERQSA